MEVIRQHTPLIFFLEQTKAKLCCLSVGKKKQIYLLLCLFFLSLFLRLWVAILWPFFFFPFGIA